MVAYLRASPESSCQFSECLSASFFGRKVGGEECDLRNFFGIGGACSMDDRQTAAPGQVRLEWFERIHTYGWLVEAPVFGVWFFCVGKRGEPC